MAPEPLPKDQPDVYVNGTPTNPGGYIAEKPGLPMKPEEDFSEWELKRKRQQEWSRTEGRARELRDAAAQGLGPQPFDPAMPVIPASPGRAGVSVPPQTPDVLSRRRLAEADRLSAKWAAQNKPLAVDNPVLIDVVDQARAAGYEVSAADLANLTNIGVLDQAARVFNDRMARGDSASAALVYASLKEKNPVMAGLLPAYADDLAKAGGYLYEAAQDPTWMQTALGWAGDVALNSPASPLMWATKEWELSQHVIRAGIYGASQDTGTGVLDGPEFGWAKFPFKAAQYAAATQTGAMDPKRVEEIKKQYPADVVDAAIQIRTAAAQGDPEPFLHLLLNHNTSVEVSNFIRDVLYPGPSLSTFDARDLMEQVNGASLDNLGDPLSTQTIQAWNSVTGGKDGYGADQRMWASQVTNVAVGFVDPLMFVGTPIRAVTAARYAIAKLAPEMGAAGRASVAAAFASRTVAGVETNRARRYFQGILDMMDRADAAGPVGSEAYANIWGQMQRHYDAVPSNVLLQMSNLDNIALVNGRRTIDGAWVDAGQGSSRKADGFVDYIQNSNEKWLGETGNIASKAIKDGEAYLINKAFEAKLLDSIDNPDALKIAKGNLDHPMMQGAQSEADLLTDAVMRGASDPYLAMKFAQKAKRDLVIPYTGALADLRRRTVNAIIANHISPKRTAAIVDKYVAAHATELGVHDPVATQKALGEGWQTIATDDRAVHGLPGRLAAAVDKVPAKFSSMPNKLIVNVATGEGAKDVYRWARMFYTHTTANYLTDKFLRGEPGQRRLIIQGLIRSGAASKGVDLTDNEVRALIGDLATGTRRGEMYAIATPYLPSVRLLQGTLDVVQYQLKDLKSLEGKLSKTQAALLREQARLDGAMQAGDDMSAAALRDSVLRLQNKVAKHNKRIAAKQAVIDGHKRRILRALNDEADMRPGPVVQQLPPATQEAVRADLDRALNEPPIVVPVQVDHEAGRLVVAPDTAVAAAPAEKAREAVAAAKAASDARRAARDASIATMPTVPMSTVAAEWRGLDSLAAAAAPTLPRDLKGSSPHYRDKKVSFTSDVDRALYIVRDSATRSKADERYMEWLRPLMPGMTDDEIRSLGDEVAARIKAQYAGSGDTVLVEREAAQSTLLDDGTVGAETINPAGRPQLDAAGPQRAQQLGLDAEGMTPDRAPLRGAQNVEMPFDEAAADLPNGPVSVLTKPWPTTELPGVTLEGAAPGFVKTIKVNGKSWKAWMCRETRDDGSIHYQANIGNKVGLTGNVHVSWAEGGTRRYGTGRGSAESTPAQAGLDDALDQFVAGAADEYGFRVPRMVSNRLNKGRRPAGWGDDDFLPEGSLITDGVVFHGYKDGQVALEVDTSIISEDDAFAYFNDIVEKARLADTAVPIASPVAEPALSDAASAAQAFQRYEDWAMSPEADALVSSHYGVGYMADLEIMQREFPLDQDIIDEIIKVNDTLGTEWARRTLTDPDIRAGYLKYLHLSGDDVPEDLAKKFSAEFDDDADIQLAATGMTGRTVNGTTNASVEEAFAPPKRNKKGEYTYPSTDDRIWWESGALTKARVADMLDEMGDEGFWSWWNKGDQSLYHHEDFVRDYGPPPKRRPDPGKGLPTVRRAAQIPGEYTLAEMDAPINKAGTKTVRALRVPWKGDTSARDAYIRTRYEEYTEGAAEWAEQGGDWQTFRQYMDGVLSERGVEADQQLALVERVPAQPAVKGAEPLPMNLLKDHDSYTPGFLQENGTMNTYGLTEEIDGVVYTISVDPQRGIRVSLWNRKASDAWNTGFIKGEDAMPMPNAAIHWDIKSQSWIPGGERLVADKAASKKDIEKLMDYLDDAEDRFDLSPWTVDSYDKLPERLPSSNPDAKIPNGTNPDGTPSYWQTRNEILAEEKAAAAAPGEKSTVPASEDVIEGTVLARADEPAAAAPPAGPPKGPPAPPTGAEPPEELPSVDALRNRIYAGRSTHMDPVTLADGSQSYTPSVDEFGRENAVHLYQTSDWIALPSLSDVEVLSKWQNNGLLSVLDTWLVRSPVDAWSILTLYGYRFSLRSSIEDLGLYLLTGGIGHVGDLWRGRQVSQAMREASPDITSKAVTRYGETTVVPKVKSRLGFFAKKSRYLSQKANLESFQSYWRPRIDDNVLMEVTAQAAAGNRVPFRRLVGRILAEKKLQGLSPQQIQDAGDLAESAIGIHMVNELAESGAQISSGVMAGHAADMAEAGIAPGVALAKPGKPVYFGEFKKLALSANEKADDAAEWLWHRTLQAIVRDDGRIGKVFVALMHEPERAKAAIAKAIREDTTFGYRERFSMITDDASIDVFAARYYEASLPYFQKADGSINEALRSRFISRVPGKNGKERMNISWYAKGAGDRQFLRTTVSDLYSMDRLDKPQYVLGRAVSDTPPIPMPTTIKTLFDTGVRKGWDWMGAQYARIAREPIFYANYLANREALRPVENKLAQGMANARKGVEAGAKTTAADQKLARIIVDRQSQDAAYQFSLNYMDNPGNRSVLAWKVRNYMRYYRATEDFARRATRLAKNYPDAYYKMAITYQILDDSAFTYRDDNGDLYFAYPMNGFLMDAFSTVDRFFKGVPSAMGVGVDPFMVGGKVKSIAPSTDPGQWAPNLTGGVGAVGATGFFHAFPQLRGLREATLGQYNTTGDTGNGLLSEVWDTLLPAGVNRAWSMMSPGERDSAMASAGAGAVASMIADGSMDKVLDPANPMTLDTLKQNDVYAEAQRRATSLMMAKGIMGWLVPASPQVYQNNVSRYAREWGMQGMSSLFHTLLNKHEGDTTAAYADWMKVDPDGSLLPFTISKTKDNPDSIRGLVKAQALIGVTDWLRESGTKDLANRFPDTYMYLQPRDAGEFDWSAWALIKGLGFRVDKSEDDMIIDMFAAQGEAQDRAMRAASEAKIATMDASTEDGRRMIAEEQAKSADKGKLIKNQNPYWDVKSNQSVDPYYVGNLYQSLTETRKMLEYLKLRDGSLTGSAQYIDAAISAWSKAQAERDLLGRSGADQEKRAYLKEIMEQKLDAIASADPGAAVFIKSILKSQSLWDRATVGAGG